MLPFLGEEDVESLMQEIKQEEISAALAKI